MPILGYLRAGQAKVEVEQLRAELRSLRDQLAALERTTVAAPKAIFEAAPATAVEAVAQPSAGTQPAALSPLAAETPPLARGQTEPAGAEPKAPDTLEEKIALVWFTRVGALAMLLGVAYFFKYAIDSDWIGPLGRVALGALAGVAVLAAAEIARARTKPIFIHVLSGVGLALLYLSAYASHAFYHLLPAAPAFAAISIVTLLGGALAIRHRAEPVLVLALIAGFAAPVLLSTGEDRPAALFGYLLVLSAAGLAVAVRIDFRIAAWVAMGGTAALFAGWYGKFFETSTDATYATLGSRSVALAAVAAYVAEWLAVYAAAKRRATLQPVAIAVAALLAAHAGLTALLFDAPIRLGALLTGIALLATALLRRERRTALLALPLAASFVVLYTTAARTGIESPVTLLSLLGLWGGIYAVAFLREQARRAPNPTPASAPMVWLACAAGVALGLLAFALLGARPATFGLVLAVLSAAFVAVALVFSLSAVAVAAAGISLVGLVLSEPQGLDHRLILVAAAWSLAYLAPSAWELLARGAEATAPRLLTLSFAGLGFVLLALRQTGPEETLLRAALVAAVGAVDLALGARLLRASRRPASLLLGQALALFASAIALLFSGATITLVWAAMFAVVAVLAARERDELWLTGALGLAAAVVVRLAGWDLRVPDEAQSRFFGTLGREGAIYPTFFLNARALAFTGSAAALLIAARSAARTQARRFVRAGAGFATLAHLLLLFVVVTESRGLAFSGPPAPLPGLFVDEFQLFVSQFAAAATSHENALSMVTTLAMAGYAGLLLAVGFGLREKLHRYLGLGLFAITLGKLGLWDVWHLPRLYQTLVLVVIGALLLGASFLYARFGRRLVALLRDGAGAALLVLLFAAPAQALPSDEVRIEVKASRFKEVRDIGGVAAPGLYRVEIDPPLYRHAQPGLADVRLAGPAGAVVPYLVRQPPVAEPEQRHPATMVDPLVLPGGGARAVFDLGRAGLKHSELRLAIDGNDFLRRSRVEVSADERHFATIAEGAFVFAVGGTSRTAIAYPLSDARYLRVTLLAGGDRQPLRITSGEVFYSVTGSHPLVRSLPVKLAAAPLSDAGVHQSAFELDLGEAGVPVERFNLDLSTAAFERRATLQASDRPPFWVTIGSGLLYRSGAQEGTTLSAGGATKRYYRVLIIDGDDAPLRARGASAEYLAEELVFRADAAGSHHLYLGAPPLAPPAYDLSAVLARGGAPVIAAATLGPIEANPLFGESGSRAPRPVSERHGVLLGVLLGAIVLGLGAWTLRLLRQSGT